MISLEQAQKEGRCRVCGKDVKRVRPKNPLVLNFGKEYAHQRCLTKAQKKLTVGVGMPQALWLSEFGSQVWSAFGEIPFHVGSSLTGKKWRDVDVRVMLDDKVYESMGFGDPKHPHQNGRWVAMCMAFSELGRKMTGLPIDFQIQQTTLANEQFPHQWRSALGSIELRMAKKHDDTDSR